MGIPDIDPDEMSDEELRRYIHELEVKAYVLEGTVKVLKAEGVEGLSNDEKVALIDACPNITATEFFEAFGISSCSYHYCRSKFNRADGYADARAAVREEFELVRGSGGTAAFARSCASERAPSAYPARRRGRSWPRRDASSPTPRRSAGAARIKGRSGAPRRTSSRAYSAPTAPTSSGSPT